EVTAVTLEPRIESPTELLLLSPRFDVFADRERRTTPKSREHIGAEPVGPLFDSLAMEGRGIGHRHEAVRRRGFRELGELDFVDRRAKTRERSSGIPKSGHDLGIDIGK